jgi:hypothetical protein
VGKNPTAPQHYHLEYVEVGDVGQDIHARTAASAGPDAIRMSRSVERLGKDWQTTTRQLVNASHTADNRYTTASNDCQLYGSC